MPPIAKEFGLPLEDSSLWKPGSIIDPVLHQARVFGLKHEHPEIEGKLVYHTGTDIALPAGTDVRAIAAGEVVFATNKYAESLGRMVVIRHQLENRDVFFSFYGHLDRTTYITSLNRTTKQ
jgi:murein DD-endopeptidase MepM/ murein hydrolase activator NlpD